MLRLLTLLCILAASLAAADKSPTAQAIRTVMAQQQADWNSGNIPGFMTGYLESPDLRFASGGSITTGWAETLARYQKHYDTPAKMGWLKFDIDSIDVFSADHAMVFGRWELTRTTDEIKPNGLFTLIFKNTPAGWRIVHDHTSSADP
jgi:ketosteroid isomerase-like protein